MLEKGIKISLLVKRMIHVTAYNCCWLNNSNDGTNVWSDDITVGISVVYGI